MIKPNDGDVDQEQVRSALATLKALIEHHYPGLPATIDHPTIQQWEMDHRRAHRPVFRAWLQSEDPIDPEAVDQLIKGVGLFNYEDHDLRVLLRHPDNVSRVRKLRLHLRDAMQMQDAEAAIEPLIHLLGEMEDTVSANPQQKKLVHGVKRKWTVPTALLSFATDRFPFIRPSNTGAERGLVAERVFRGLPWESTVRAERYAAYCKRYQQICTAMADVGIAPDGIEPADASAWMVAAHALAKEPDAIKKVTRLVKQGPTILQGPPGTGKTHRVERLAHSLSPAHRPTIRPADQYDGQAKVDVVTELVQFHASYDYEDFVRGFRPIATAGGVAFELRDGPFTRMVSWALAHPDTSFLLVVDEINRADLARVLGECIYLLDRRVPRSDVDAVWMGTKPGAASLRYPPQTPAASPKDYDPAAGKLLAKLCIPDNFYLVGTMNTADRSIAVVDSALRRRFAFYDVLPDPSVVMQNKALTSTQRRAIQIWMARLNGDEDGAEGLITDARYHIGHAYFLGSPDLVASRIVYQLVPLLEEYARDRRLRSNNTDLSELLEDLRGFRKA